MDQVFRRIRRGRLGGLSQRDVEAINRGLITVEEHDRFRASPGLAVRQSRTGLVVTDVTRQGFWARITDTLDGEPPIHAWEEVYESGPEGWEAVDPQAPGTLSDNPAYEVNGGTAPAGTIVWLEPQEGSEPPFWLFEAPGVVTLTDAVTIPPDSTWTLNGVLIFSGVGPLIVNVPLTITDTWEWAHYPCLTPHDLTLDLTSYDSTDLTLHSEPWWRVLLSAGGDVTWTGLPAPTDDCGADLWLTVLEASDGDLVLEHEQAGSPAAAQFLTPDTDPWLTAAGESTHLRYDPTTERWRVMHRLGGGAAAPAAFSGAQVRRASGVNGAGVQTFDTEEYDTDGYFSILSPTQFTVPTTDKYRVGVYTTLTATAGGSLRDGFGSIQINGANVRNQGFTENLTEPYRYSAVYIDFEAEFSLTAGDTVKFSLTAATSSGVAGNGSRMWISRVQGGSGGGAGVTTTYPTGTTVTYQSGSKLILPPSAPSSPSDGTAYWDTTSNDLKVWDAGTAGYISIGSGGSGGGLTDGDKGEITVSGSGATWVIDPGVVTYAKIQDVSATQRVLGRNTAGAGDVEEVTLSQLLDWVGGAANGDLLTRTGGAWDNLAKGAAGRVLRAGATLPEYSIPGELIALSDVKTSESTTSTTYTDLTTPDSVTFTLIENTTVLIDYSALCGNSSASPFAQYSIINLAGVDITAAEGYVTNIGANFRSACHHYHTITLAAGAHTVKVRHRAEGGTSTWRQRRLAVWKLAL